MGRWGGWRLVDSSRSASSASIATAFVPSLDPNWWQRWQLQGHNPSVVLDDANGLYYDGTQTLFSPSTLRNNGVVTPGSGLLCNINNISLKGAALSAFQGNVYSTQVVTTGGTNGQFAAAIATSPDGSTLLDQILVENTSNGIYSFKTATSDTVTTSGTFDFTKTLYWGFANSITGGYRTVSGFQSGNASVGNDAVSLVANPNSVFVGSLTPQFSDDFGGFMQQLAVINGFAPAAGYQFLPPAWVGPNAFWYNFSVTNGISYGAVLQYEYTQPWTVIAAICVITAAGSGTSGVTGIVFSNVPDQSPYPGYELWLDGTPNLRIRLIHNFTTALVDIVGSTNLNDGKWHVVCGTSDGSGTAAGCKLYVDGVLETITTLSDNLGGQTIKGGGGTGINNNFYFIGNQSPATGAGTGEIGILALPGAIGMFRQYNVVKPLSFIQNFLINQLLPPIDSSCVLAPKLNEGGSNTTTADLSASGLTGTLTSSSCWLRG